MFFLLSCKENNDIDIVGNYEIDKVIVKNQTNNISDYRFLKIYANNTFELNYNKKDTIAQVKGIWKLKRINSEKTLVEFVYNNKKIEGVLDGTIFYFTYPNDFHNGKYESILYVKLNNVPN
ncbi:hypothetical protein [Flavobacterium indicum]|nr:hypothetical protein [Flavobacterium indicum]